MRDQGLTDHLGRNVARLAGGFAEVHTALESVGERSLPASTRVNLRFDHDRVGPEIARHFLRFLGRASHRPARIVRTELGEDFLGLIFVDIHAW